MFIFIFVKKSANVLKNIFWPDLDGVLCTLLQLAASFSPTNLCSPPPAPWCPQNEQNVNINNKEEQDQGLINIILVDHCRHTGKDLNKHIEVFYLNSTLNFGIPPVLVFQLEVCYKVDRLLTGLTAHQKEQVLDGIQIKHLYMELITL